MHGREGEEISEIIAKVAETPVSEFIAVKKVDTPVPAYLEEDGVRLSAYLSAIAPKGVDAMKFHTEWVVHAFSLVKHMTGYCGYNQNLVVDRLVDREHVGYECRSPFRGHGRILLREHGRLRRVLWHPGSESC